MSEQMPGSFETVLALADDHLVLGHRLSEWCGHAPTLEEDLALANLALDLIGSARALYTYAGALEGAGRSEDDLAYLRDERGFRNCLLVEQENEDFAHTMLRQLWFAAFMELYWQSALRGEDDTLREIAGRAVKEMAYHTRHCGEWVVRLGRGTAESARRLSVALEALHIYLPELFDPCANGHHATLPNRAALQAPWEEKVGEIMSMAGVLLPETPTPLRGGRSGVHGEALGHMLAEMQSVHRAYPGARW